MNVSNAKCLDQAVLTMSEFVNKVTRPYIEGILQGAILNGHDIGPILEKAGLPDDLLDDPNASIDGEAFQQLLITLEAETGDYFLGFLNEPGKLAMVGQQLKLRHQCQTFGEFVRVSTGFREAVRNDVHYDCLVDEEGHEFTVNVAYQLRPGIDPHIFYWHRLMLIDRYWSWIIGKRIKLNRVTFTTPKPDYALDYETLFHCQVLYEQPHDSLSFDLHYLHLAVVRSEQETEEFITKNMNWLVPPGQDRSWSRQVEDILIRLQHEDLWNPSIDQVAGILNLRARTLRRLLARENENFQAIRSRVRCDRAKSLLTTTDMPITVIAGEIGYTEPGVFTRAFQGWTHMTPSDYRAAHRRSAHQVASG